MSFETSARSTIAYLDARLQRSRLRTESLAARLRTGDNQRRTAELGRDESSVQFLLGLIEPTTRPRTVEAMPTTNTNAVETVVLSEQGTELAELSQAFFQQYEVWLNLNNQNGELFRKVQGAVAQHSSISAKVEGGLVELSWDFEKARRWTGIIALASALAMVAAYGAVESTMSEKPPTR